jgi:hypothetical protein
MLVLRDDTHGDRNVLFIRSVHVTRVMSRYDTYLEIQTSRVDVDLYVVGLHRKFIASGLTKHQTFQGSNTLCPQANECLLIAQGALLQKPVRRLVLLEGIDHLIGTYSADVDLAVALRVLGLDWRLDCC